MKGIIVGLDVRFHTSRGSIRRIRDVGHTNLRAFQRMTGRKSYGPMNTMCTWEAVVAVSMLLAILTRNDMRSALF